MAFSPQGIRVERGGNNLYISGPDGARIIIAGYFARPELAPFRTEDGELFSGSDFLMIMNPDMDLTTSDPFSASQKGCSSFFRQPDKSWDEGIFYSLTSEGDIPDYGFSLEEAAVTTGPLAPKPETGAMGKDDVRYWVGRDACQGRAFLRELDGSISVSLITPPGAAVEAFLSYVAMNGEAPAHDDLCKLDKESKNTLFQDGSMGRVSITLCREPTGDTLLLTAEAFLSFQAYYGGWLSEIFPTMQVEGIEILMNAPSGQSVVDLQEYFGNAVFSDVAVAWSYDERPKVAGNLAEFADEGFNLMDLIDALEPEQEQLSGPPVLPAEEDTLFPRVENVVLVRADTNDAVNLSEDWTQENVPEDTSYRTLTLSEQTLLIQGKAPPKSDMET